MNVQFAFTVKCNTKGYYPLVSDYNDWIQHAETKGCKVNVYYFEVDKKDKLHMHGVLTAPPNLYKRSLLYKSFHQRIDLISSFLDLTRWADYIAKDYINTNEYHQRLLEYEYRHLTYDKLWLPKSS